MTTIVAVHENGKYAIAADSLVTSVHTRIGLVNKLIEVEDDIGTVIGVSGPQTALLALRSVLKNIELTFGSTDEVYNSFLMIHDELKNQHGLVTTNGESDQNFECMQFEALVVNTAGIYQVLSYREVIQHENWCAIGNGAEFAMGYLYALGTRQVPTPELEAVASNAVMCAVNFDKDTGGHIDTLLIEPAEDGAA